jgi:uncharacterized membrane protein YccF (DUF307 family)
VKSILNVIRPALSGLWLFPGYVLAGLVLCITIVGIPFGMVSLCAASRSGRPAIR